LEWILSCKSKFVRIDLAFFTESATLLHCIKLGRVTFSKTFNSGIK